MVFKFMDGGGCQCFHTREAGGNVGGGVEDPACELGGPVGSLVPSDSNVAGNPVERDSVVVGTEVGAQSENRR